VSAPRTIIEKIWDTHVVPTDGTAASTKGAGDGSLPSVLYIDLHLVHEVTSPQAFDGLRRRRLVVRRPDLTLATTDHSTPTYDRSLPIADPQAASQVAQLEQNCAEFGIRCYGRASDRQGIVHVIGPELGLTQPGMTIVCGDSHTATDGAFGALAFGIGTSEVEMVLATQCLLQRKPGTFRITVDGHLRPGVDAKDLILAIIARIGMDGGTGCVFEYAGPAIRTLSMDERMTVCNMSIEAGARAGLIAPDETTFEYLAGRPFAPQGAGWDRAIRCWSTLATDVDATFDREMTLDADELEPMITFGTNPGMAIPITAPVPDPAGVDQGSRRALAKALAYMGLAAGKPILGHPVDVVFIGSCTNGRLTDLREAARALRGRRVHARVRTLVVPGSQQVKHDAEAEGLDQVIRDAGAEWREPGCSMCIAMNGDMVGPGQVAVSTSNRNFEGRQGKDARTLLASPATAAASAIRGAVADPREFLV
jgi:3-isopropylmalate/(R)-2-methylmalate dehydratase large subunit